MAVPIPQNAYRSPTAFWRAFHGGPLPIGAAWARLLQDAKFDGLDQLPRPPDRGAALRIASWTARWLVDLGNAKAQRNRVALGRRLRAGRIVLLQETHRDGTAAAIWARWVFLHCRVFAAPATTAAGGGPHGGVAVLCPAPLACADGRVVVPGCAVAAVIEDPCGLQHTVVSVYLPPGRLPRPGGRVVLGGNFNLDLAQTGHSSAQAHAGLGRPHCA